MECRKDSMIQFVVWIAKWMRTIVSAVNTTFRTNTKCRHCVGMSEEECQQCHGSVLKEPKSLSRSLECQEPRVPSRRRRRRMLTANSSSRRRAGLNDRSSSDDSQRNKDGKKRNDTRIPYHHRSTPSKRAD